MNLRSILESVNASLTSADLRAENGQTAALLGEYLALFDSNVSSAMRSIRQLQIDDSPGFAVAAIHALITRADSPALEYLANLVASSEALIEPLCDPSLFSLGSAISLAGKVASEIPLLDVKLVRRLILNGADPDEQTTLRTLSIVSEISDCHRLLPLLNQVLRHRSVRVRSKAARLISRIHQSQAVARALVSSSDRGDPRITSNSLEDMKATPANSEFLWEAAADKHHRISTTALAVLARGGNAEAAERLIMLTSDPRPLHRAAAAWALGQVPSQDSQTALKQLARDKQSSVRTMAIRSLVKIRRSNADNGDAEPAPAEPPSPSTGDEPPNTPDLESAPAEPSSPSADVEPPHTPGPESALALD